MRSSPPTFFSSFGPRRWAARATWRRAVYLEASLLAGFAADRPIRYTAATFPMRGPSHSTPVATVALVLSIFCACISTSDRDWVRIDSGVPAAQSPSLKETFDLDVRACTQHAEAVVGPPRRIVPSRPGIDLKPQVEDEEWDDWTEEFDSCMTKAGWERRS